MDGYVPRLPAERVEALRAWHEHTSAAIHARGAVDLEYLGLHLHVPADVFAPTATSDLLGGLVAQEVRPGQRVLDMGSGAGANAILAARAGAEVVAVDVNPSAVAATADNAARNGVAVDARASDVWSAVDGRFDLIVVDPPFRWFAPGDMLDRAFADEGYEALGRFVAGVRDHLEPGGRVLLFFGTSGDVGHLDELIVRHGLVSETRAERVIDVRGERTTYFVRSITAPAARIRQRVAAYVVCRDAEARILLTRYVAPGYDDDGHWVLPGGGMEWGEQPRDTAAREVREETGLDIEVGDLLGVISNWFTKEESINDEVTHALAVVFTATVTGGELHAETSGTTDAVAWFTLAEARALPTVRLVDGVLELLEG